MLTRLMTVPIAIALLAATVSAATTYPPKYDNLDVTSVLQNDRLYSKYFLCLTHSDNSKCTTPESKELRSILPDALATGCSKCTEKQKENTEKVIKYLIDHKPEDFKALEKIYDPTGNYKKKYEAQAAAKGIKL